MSLRFLMAIGSCLICLSMPGMAQAEWRYDPGYGPAGRALGFGSGGQSIAMECGNGGYPAFVMFGPRPVGGELADYVLRIDQTDEQLLLAECSADGCLLLFDDSPDVRRFTQGLQQGLSMSVGFLRNGLWGDIPLTGANAAIDQVFAAGCEAL